MHLFYSHYTGEIKVEAEENKMHGFAENVDNTDFHWIARKLRHYKDVVDVESCKGVHNFIPSISAVTSAKPGAYTWKISIALHVGPRLMICSAYYNFFLHRLKNIPQHWRDNYLLAVSVTYWLNIIENLSLVGVTYITNLDNYPVHEKLFITFMGTSTAYMVFTVLLLKYSNTVAPWMSTDLWSYRVKIICLLLILIFSAGMGIFFYYHRMYCQPKGTYLCVCVCACVPACVRAYIRMKFNAHNSIVPY
ncbi:PREDICTED: post-GPI attachment to proteins factor 2-like [Priapulus caudatus]|uniref:Post-GPI attachment to proteins factor 2-like n=1 Tax=Priapulus caudatus TaxID=37621 RepID=A0ABM1EHS8_PRICU|nr:PREDICTED: post-GPI attachment to proteins factor 2-like [Priapulus caudatus]